MNFVDIQFLLSVHSLSQLPVPSLPEIAFAGRSNVGKSSLMNTLVGRKSLVKVSGRPGKTQGLNFFEVADKVYLVDLPGYGYAKVAKGMQDNWQALITSYLESRKTLCCVGHPDKEGITIYTLASMLPRKHTEGVTVTIIGLLGPHKGKRHTMTFDNGKEFAVHESITKNLKMAVYFAHPYHSWERGLNENTNGLLRQYFPKGSSFEKVTEVQVQSAVDSLNHRPRKILGFKTQFEVFFGKTMRYSASSLGVALRS